MGEGSVTFHPTPNCEAATDKLETNRISIRSVLASQSCKPTLTHLVPDTPIIQPDYPQRYVHSSPV